MEFLPKGMIVNSVRYYKTVCEIKQVHWTRLERGTFFCFGLWQHKTHQMAQMMGNLKLPILVHSILYHPDLLPSDFWLSLKLKEALKGEDFSLNAEIEFAGWSKIKNNLTSFIDGMKKLIQNLKKMCNTK